MGLIDLLVYLALLIARLDNSPGCYEDEVVVMVVQEVLPENGRPPGLDWGVGSNWGRTLCINADDFGL